MIKIGDIVTVNMQAASYAFKRSVKKYHYGIVEFTFKEKEGEFATIMWFTKDCYLVHNWSVGGLIRVGSFFDYLGDIERNDFSSLEKLTDKFEAENPFS